MMQTTRSKAVALSLLGLGLVVLGALYYFFVYQSEPERVAILTYACDDGSFYLLSFHEDRIGVAGHYYELVPGDIGMRYEGEGPMAFVIDDEDTLRVSDKASGEMIAQCAGGTVENPPIIETAQQ